MAAGMFELIPIRVISASSPCLLKMPSSTAIIAEAQSVVAVHPIWILVCAWAGAAANKATAAAAALNVVIEYLPPGLFSGRSCLSIFFLIIYFLKVQGETRLKLATFHAGG